MDYDPAGGRRSLGAAEPAEYTQQMYEYDRDCLEEYADTVSRVQELESQQAEALGSLQAMKTSRKNSRNTSSRNWRKKGRPPLTMRVRWKKPVKKRMNTRN